MTNVWWRVGDALHTPSLDLGILAGRDAGDARSSSRRRAATRVEEGAYPLEQLLAADEAFTSSSVREVMPLVEIDGRDARTRACGGRAPGRRCARSQLRSERWTKTPVRLGGMALQNGVLVHGPTSWGCAVRDADGALHVASGRKPHLAPAARQRMPVLRGPIALAEAFALLPTVRRALPQARFPFERPSVLGAIARRRLSPRARCAARGCPPARGRSPPPVSRSFPPRSRCAGPTSPPTTARSTSRSAPTRTAASRRRRSTRAAARSSSRRWSRRRSRRTSSRRRRPRARAALARLVGTVGAIGGSVELFSWVARNPEHPRRAGARAARLRAPAAPLDGGAVGRSARGRERRARRLPRARATAA